MNRTEFLRTCSLYALSIAGTSLLLESCKKNNASPDPQGPTVNFTLDLTQSANSALNTSGGSLASHGVVVANDGGTYISVARSCTHQGCSVEYSSGGHDFVCPCHNGTYDSNGNVTGGPPQAPLKKYSVTKSGNILTIAG